MVIEQNTNEFFSTGILLFTGVLKQIDLLAFTVEAPVFVYNYNPIPTNIFNMNLTNREWGGGAFLHPLCIFPQVPL